MKLFLLILVCIFLISYGIYFIKNLKNYLNIYNDYAGGIKRKRVYGTKDTTLLKPHFKKAINYYCLGCGFGYTSYVLCLILTMCYIFEQPKIRLLFLLLAMVFYLIYAFCNFKRFIVAKSHTHIMLGRYMIRISDVKSVQLEDDCAFEKIIVTFKSGRTKRYSIDFNMLAYDFILKTIEENAEVQV